MHEDPVLKCLFGCSDAIDSQTHYVMCPHLFALQKFLFEDTSSDPLVRLCVKSPSLHSMKICSCLYSAYHAVKSSVRSGRISLHGDGLTQPSLQLAWSVFANVAAAEAGELRVFSRAFSLPKFLCLLCVGRLPNGGQPCNYLMQPSTH